MAALHWSSVAALVLLLTFTERSEAQTVHVVVANLLADGTRVPGGYAVPVGGNITFTCTHNGSSGRSLFWEYDIANRTATKFPTTAVSLRDEPGFSTSATENTANPVSITIYNLQLANNGSTVKCQLEQEGLPAVIRVEGVPSCAVVDISPPMASSVNATLSASEHPWFLPVWFNVMVTSGDQTKSFNTTVNKFNIYPIHHMTTYNVSVIPCNAVGCHEDCLPYVANISTSPTEETTDMSSPGSNPSSGPEMNSLHAIIGVVSFGVTLIVAALVLIILVVWIVKWRSKNRGFNSTKMTASTTSPQGKPPATSESNYATVHDCVSSSSTPTKDGRTSVPGIDAIDTVGYGEVAHSAPKLQRVRSNNYASKRMEDGYKIQVSSMTRYATRQHSLASVLSDTTTIDDPPPPHQPHDMNTVQEAAPSPPSSHGSDNAPQAHNNSRSSNGSLPTETADEVAL